MDKRQDQADVSRGTGRRDFAKTVALLAATPLAASSGPIVAQQPARAEGATTVADALMEIVRLRYGKYLTAEQLKLVRTRIVRGQSSADLLRQVKLQNGDEPAFVFSADVP